MNDEGYTPAREFDRRLGDKKVVRDHTYNVLVFLARHVIPIFGSMYFIVAIFLGADPQTAMEVLGGLIVAEAVIGILIGYLSYRYHAEEMFNGLLRISDEHPEKEVYLFEFWGSPENLKDMDRAVFKIETTRQKQGV